MRPIHVVDAEALGDAAETYEIVDPAKGAAAYRAPIADARRIEAAIASAARAQAAWGCLTGAERGASMAAGVAALRAAAEELAHALVVETGKPLAEARGEVAGAIDTLDYFAAEARRIGGAALPARAGLVRSLVVKEPVGVVAAFTPWNFPLLTSARKAFPAIAAGCAVILKPAEETPTAAAHMARIVGEAGLPKGVLNVVFGNPAQISSALLCDPRVAKGSFTGSTPVGRLLAGIAAAHLKPLTLELGGHAPVIVAGDVDPAAAAALAAVAKFRNAGQICTSPTRFFVHASVREAFTAAFAGHARALRLGSGMDAGVTMGPLASERRLTAVLELVADAVQRGARLVCGGSRHGNRGFFVAPTVLADVPDEARIMREEPFGPVAIINGYDELDDAIVRANDTPYGLAAYVISRDAATIHAVQTGLACGLVGVNTFSVSSPDSPFGGVRDSGYGRECGAEGIESYLVTKYVAEAAPPGL